jgi:hypothetical protein
MFALLLIVLVALLVPAQALTKTPSLSWDERLDELGVTLQPATDCTNGCWRLITARLEDDQESGGNHNIFSRLYGESGDMIAGAPWHAAWPDGDIELFTKAPPEWADFPIFACYNPERGPGAYYAYAGSDQSKSDVVRGMGLPQCLHVNYRLEWQWQTPPEPEQRLWLPLVRQ